MYARTLCAALLLAGTAMPATASLVTTQTRQETFAIICTDGSPLCAGGDRSQVDNVSVDAASHSNNFDGDLTTPSEARTAARSGPMEIAANASIVHRGPGPDPFRNYTDVFGDSLFEWDVLVLNDSDVSFTFRLPPGFVETQSNIEFSSFLDLTAAVQVDIQYCSPACGFSPANDSLFQMFSRLEGNFDTYQLSNGASSVNPGLDTSPLTHQNVVQTDGVGAPIPLPTRTWTWEFPAFTGQIPLGHFVGGQTFSLSYRMIAEVYSDFGAFETWAAAAINDPFFLSSDSLPPQSLGAFTFVPSGGTAVPEPGTWLLLGMGLMGVMGYARRRHRAA
jgi:hypothetical protein